MTINELLKVLQNPLQMMIVFQHLVLTPQPFLLLPIQIPYEPKLRSKVCSLSLILILYPFQYVLQIYKIYV